MLKAIAGTEVFDDEWHPVSTKYGNNIDSVAIRATVCKPDNVNLRHK